MLTLLNGIINEQFNYRRYNEGDITFTKSSLTDPHIVDILEFVSKESGVPVNILEQKAQHGIDKMTEMAKIAPLLNSTIAQNAAESEAFYMLCAVDGRPPGSPKFSVPLFRDLRIEIATDHQSGFWPLQGNIDRRPLENPSHFTEDNEINFADELVKAHIKSKTPGAPPPAKKDMSRVGSRVDTAAATPGGEFYFNVPFMQKLIDFAYLKKLKPNGVKYVSNGGMIPDEYGYIEFIILHEYLHYMEEDFYYQHIIPNANATLINYAGDYRSNYLLVKSGYSQIPIGLFSDNINFDRQKSYAEMYKIIDDELSKFPQQGGGGKRPIKVGDKVKMPDGTPGIVEEIFKGKAKVKKL